MAAIEPVIIGRYRLSPEFFRKTRLRNRCRLQCAEACCDEGVYLSLYDAHRILARRDEIQPYLEQPLDFDAWDLSRAADISTPVRNEGTPQQQCWFLDKNKCCVLHKLAIDKQIPVSSIKPYFCLMFPLTLTDIDINVNEIAIDGKAYTTCLVPCSEETYLYTQFESDLRRILGDEGFAELERRFPA